MKHASGNHPANNGKVMLVAWVEPALREYVRTRAHEAGVKPSEWVATAVMKHVTTTALGAYCFPTTDEQPEVIGG